MSRNDLIQFRVSTEDKERIRRRAQAIGLTITEFARDRTLEGIGGRPAAVPRRKGQARVPKTDGEPVPRTEEERHKGQLRKAVAEGKSIDVQVQAGSAEPQDREAFVKRRTTQIHGQGKTMRLAKQLAEAEWRNR